MDFPLQDGDRNDNPASPPPPSPPRSHQVRFAELPDPPDLPMNHEGPPGENPYSFRIRNVREYRTRAIDTTYEILFSMLWRGRNLRDLLGTIYRMFMHLLMTVTVGMHPNDLWRVVIHNDSLHHPIIVALTTLRNLTPEHIMDKIEAALNSNEQLQIDGSFKIDLGIIKIPRVGNKHYLSILFGDSDNETSMKRKRLIIQIINDDLMCLACSIAMGWAKLNKISTLAFNQLVANTPNLPNKLEDKILALQKVPEWYYKKMTDKGRQNQKHTAVAICKLAGMALNRAGSLLDIPLFENALNINISVIGSRHKNGFIRVSPNNEMPNVYLYLVESEKDDDISTPSRV